MKRINHARPAIMVGFPHLVKDEETKKSIQPPAVVIAEPGDLATYRRDLKARLNNASPSRVDSTYHRIEIWNQDGVQMGANFMSPDRAESRVQTTRKARAHQAKKDAEYAEREAARIESEAKAARERANQSKSLAKQAGAAFDAELESSDLKPEDLHQETPPERDARIAAEREEQLKQEIEGKKKAQKEQRLREAAEEKARESVVATESEWEKARREELRDLATSGGKGRNFTKEGRNLLLDIAEGREFSLGGSESAGQLIEIIVDDERAERVRLFGALEQRVAAVLDGGEDPAATASVEDPESISFTQEEGEFAGALRAELEKLSPEEVAERAKGAEVEFPKDSEDLTDVITALVEAAVIARRDAE